jgi:hypothetical protein
MSKKNGRMYILENIYNMIPFFEKQIAMTQKIRFEKPAEVFHKSIKRVAHQN